MTSKILSNYFFVSFYIDSFFFRAIDDLGEVTYNVLYARLPFKEHTLKRLKKGFKENKADLRYIAERSKDVHKRRKKLARQSGSGKNEVF